MVEALKNASEDLEGKCQACQTEVSVLEGRVRMASLVCHPLPVAILQYYGCIVKLLVRPPC